VPDTEPELVPPSFLDEVPVEEAPVLDTPRGGEAATRVAGGDADELERLRSLWQNVADQIRARSKNMGGVFANPDMVRPARVSGGVATISFRDQFHAARSMTNSASAPYRDIIESALSRVLGYRCLLECITFEQEARGAFGGDDMNGGGKPVPKGKGPKGPAAPKQPSPYETTRGKAAMNIFGIDKFDDNG